MWINTITFTGADDGVDPIELGKLSQKYPFIEWGILFPSTGGYRFPSKEWIANLTRINQLYPMKLSAHLCEPWVPWLVTHGYSLGQIENEMGTDAWKIFKRVQINLHGHPYTFHQNFVEEIKATPEKEFILQLDNVNNDFIEAVDAPNTSLLVDTSHGAGHFSNEWPQYLGKKYGYAGGLGIDTLPQAVEKWQDNNLFIEWIDMETKIREGGSFSLPRVKEVIEYMQDFIWLGTKAVGANRYYC